MPQITVGLDFGTHQTKVCIEKKEGAEQSYEFFMFKDNRNWKQFTLPSVLCVDDEDHIHYGYILKGQKGKLVKYFKQATFTDKNDKMSKTNAIYFSIWYIAYILFDLEEVYGQEFAIQMGVPTDGEHLEEQQKLAVRILLSAYRLVEEVFEHDKEKFLAATMHELCTQTELVPYDEDQKFMYSILVFPEAYACLMPLVKSKKIARGMSLMVDIGGGTTDISFFTIPTPTDPKETQRPLIYDFHSLNKGLNYLTDADQIIERRVSSNVKNADEISRVRNYDYEKDIRMLCGDLWNRLVADYKKSGRHLFRLQEALKGRPIIYTGGGSTFDSLRTEYNPFTDIIHISEKEWRRDIVKDMDIISEQGLCPILSTAYGLSISVEDDVIESTPFNTLFNGLMPNGDTTYNNSGMANDKANYYDGDY